MAAPRAGKFRSHRPEKPPLWPPQGRSFRKIYKVLDLAWDGLRCGRAESACFGLAEGSLKYALSFRYIKQ
jgi:hypothetical protein